MSPWRLSQAADRLRRTPARRAVVSFKHRGLSACDVMLASYPRSGNTWVTLMLADLLTGQRVDMRDHVMPSSLSGPARMISTIGDHRHAPGALPSRGRLIKTHEPYRYEYRHAIYLVRDVRDVAASVFRMREYETGRSQDWDEFLDDFAAGHVGGWGSWHDHVAGWCAASRGSADILVIRYEELVDEPAIGLARISQFLEIEASAERLQAVADNHSAGEVRRLSGQDAGVLTQLMANATYGRWRDVFDVHQLSKLAPAMEIMHRMGYETSEAK